MPTLLRMPHQTACLFHTQHSWTRPWDTVLEPLHFLFALVTTEAAALLVSWYLSAASVETPWANQAQKSSSFSLTVSFTTALKLSSFCEKGFEHGSLGYCVSNILWDMQENSSGGGSYRPNGQGPLPDFPNSLSLPVCQIDLLNPISPAINPLSPDPTYHQMVISSSLGLSIQTIWPQATDAVREFLIQYNIVLMLVDQ